MMYWWISALVSVFCKIFILSFCKNEDKHFDQYKIHYHLWIMIVNIWNHILSFIEVIHMNMMLRRDR
jgi:hypothetical protein